MKSKFCLLFIYLYLFQYGLLLTQPLPSKNICIVGGISNAGSGDNLGPLFTAEYTAIIKNNWFFSGSIGSTIHSEKGIPVSFIYNNQNIDATIHETTAGIQAVSHIGFSFINNSKNLLGIKSGLLLRYQSTSSTAIVTALFPIATNLPYPVYVYDNISPQLTYSIGLSGQLFYTYKINKKLGVGLLSGFQFDSNGDNISQLSLSITRFLK